MKKLVLVISTTILIGCYQAPNLKDFDQEKWEKAITECTNYRLVAAKDLIDLQRQMILGLNQNEITKLFGNPTQHLLHSRNQKFFFYQLDCDNTKRLSLRFDALGRVKEIQIEKVSN